MDLQVADLWIMAMDDNFECIRSNKLAADGHTSVVIGGDFHLRARANSTEVAVGLHIRYGGRHSSAGHLKRLLSSHGLGRPVAGCGNPVVPGDQGCEPKQRIHLIDRTLLAQ